MKMQFRQLFLWGILFTILLTASNSAFAFFDTTIGRFISRDPVEESSFRHGYLISLKPQEQFELSQRKPIGNEFVFVQNDSIDRYDPLGLCPAETCDKWTISVILMQAVGIDGPAGLDVRTTLTADGNCCMKEHMKYYRYLGYGLGVGAERTINYSVGSHTFTTPCIPWSAHVGIGRVTGVGFGIVRTYGLTYFTTPQAYFSIASPSWGIDAGIFTTAGYWWFEKNGPN